MDKNAGQLIKQINLGKNLKENIPHCLAMLEECYGQTSLLSLSMEYDILYEKLLDHQDRKPDFADDTLEVINQCIKAAFLEDSKTEEAVRLLSAERERVIEKMQVLTMYADTFILYEHVLNRMELNYAPFAIAEEEDFLQRLVMYIFKKKDDAAVNEKIKQVICQLPVRMAKSRYFELVRSSLSVYVGSERASVDTYDYMLRTSAMLYMPEGAASYFKEYGELRRELEEMDFEQLAREPYLDIMTRIKEAADSIVQLTDFYMLLQETINHLYAYLLAGGKSKGGGAADFGTEEGSAAGEACVEIIAAVHAAFQKEKKELLDEKIMDKFIATEGMQEQLLQLRDLLEGVLPKAQAFYEQEGEESFLLKRVETLLLCSRLMSDSLFMEFKEVKTQTADLAYIQKVTGLLIHDLEEEFKSRPRKVMRAVIAETISKMPMFFKSMDEVVNYIENSLLQCKDAGEKQVSVNILNDIMQDDW